MLDCIIKKGREVFLNTNEFQHLGLPEVWSLPPVSSPSVRDLHMSETDEWRLGSPGLRLRVWAVGKAAHPSGRPPSCESLHATSLPGALANSPLFLPPWLNARGQEWPLGNISKGCPLSGHLGTFTEGI